MGPPGGARRPRDGLVSAAAVISVAVAAVAVSWALVALLLARGARRDLDELVRALGRRRALGRAVGRAAEWTDDELVAMVREADPARDRPAPPAPPWEPT